MKIGIVGLPNAGKSSLFNALTKAGAEAANYPFTTIDPNVAVVPVRDERLERVASTVGASEIVWDTIDFHDIAGLVAGARCYARLGLPAAPLYALAAALSLSRLYLGVHYPSDVLAGALLGSAAAALGAQR